MTNILEGLMSQFGDDTVSKMSSTLGLEKNQAQSVLASALPTMLKAIANNTKSEEGANSFMNALNKDHDGGILDNVAGFIQGSGSGGDAIGSKILGHLMGGKRDAIQTQISSDSGLNSNQVGNLMEMAAPLLMGFLGKQNKQTEGNGILNLIQMASGFMGGNSNSGNDGGGMVSNILNSILDSDGDGSMMDDIAEKGMGMLGGLFGKK